MLPALEQLGLSPDEARVYLALLELGGGYVSQVAKKAGKQRATCYYTLALLLEKGLATRVQRGSYQFFSPETPQKIVSISQAKLKLAEELLPELLSVRNSLAKKPKVRFYEGAAGIESIFLETLNAQHEILGWTDLEALFAFSPDFFRRYLRDKVARKISTRYIAPKPADVNKLLKALSAKTLNSTLLEVLFVNPKEFPFKNEIAVYQNKVAVMSLAKDETIAFLIESYTLAESMRSVFNLAWLGATSFIAI